MNYKIDTSSEIALAIAALSGERKKLFDLALNTLENYNRLHFEELEVQESHIKIGTVFVITYRYNNFEVSLVGDEKDNIYIKFESIFLKQNTKLKDIKSLPLDMKIESSYYQMIKEDLDLNFYQKFTEELVSKFLDVYNRLEDVLLNK